MFVDRALFIRQEELLAGVRLPRQTFRAQHIRPGIRGVSSMEDYTFQVPLRKRIKILSLTNLHV